MLGRSLLLQAFAAREAEMTEAALAHIREEKKLESDEEIFYQIGKAQQNADTIVRTLFTDPDEENAAVAATKPIAPLSLFPLLETAPITGLLPGVALDLGKCCHPLPGDRIIGLLKESGGVAVHRIDCDIPADYEDSPELWLDLKWEIPAETQEKTRYSAAITLDIFNEPGALGTIAGIIGHNEGNITNLSVLEQKQDYYRFHVELEVFDTRHLQNIMNLLKTTPQTARIERNVG